MARLYDAVADIAENNGVADVRGLFTAAGDIVTGWKWVDGKYGDSIRADGKWFNPSQATNGARRLSADTKKGFTFGVVRGAAVVRMGNNWTPVIELVAGADVEAVTAVDVTYYRND